MKREVISEALNNISEEYRAEALEMHSLEVVSGPKNMKKKIVTIVLAAAITTALGATAYAAISGSMTSRDGEPGETLTYVSPAYTCDVTEEDEEGNQIQTTLYEDEQTFVYEDISKVFTFDGRESCNEIQFMATYLPEGYTVMCGAANEWTDVAQGDYQMDTRYYNIKVYYASQFGPDGSLFSQDNFYSEEVIEDGDFIIYKLSGTVYNTDIPVFFYLMYNTVEGYIIEIDSTESMEICENIAAGLEIRTTGGVVHYNPNEPHDHYLCTGVG
jgi:hypothetical protein